MALGEDDDRLSRARLALDGLSVGDAFGQQFFTPGMPEWCIEARRPPPPVWRYTDDSEMAMAIVEVLISRGRIDQERLAARFAERWSADSMRGYGPGAHRVLHAIACGEPWRDASRASFRGEGSLGNGGAMRVAPVGAYFAGELSVAANEAAASAEITHAHPEGIAGAVAVAVAAAWCCMNPQAAGTKMLEAVLDLTPAGATRAGIEDALAVPLDEWEFTAANQLGNGSQITAVDTVPFALWCVAAHLDSFTDALWAAARVGGDIDTNCAIVGGIVACRVGPGGLPAEWRASREALSLDLA